MGNNIVASELIGSQKTSKKVTIPSVTQKNVPKEGLSLFDKLLQTATNNNIETLKTQSEKDTKQKNETPKTSNTQTIQTTKSKQEKDTQENKSVDTKQTNKSIETSKTQTPKTSKTQNEKDIQENKSVDTKQTNKSIETSKTQTPKTSKTQNEKDIQENKSTDTKQTNEDFGLKKSDLSSKEESKTTKIPSLFDKIVQDYNENKKTIVEKKEQSNNNKLIDRKIENIDDKKTDNSSIDKQIKPNTPNETVQNKTIIKDVEQKVDLKNLSKVENFKNDTKNIQTQDQINLSKEDNLESKKIENVVISKAEDFNMKGIKNNKEETKVIVNEKIPPLTDVLVEENTPKAEPSNKSDLTTKNLDTSHIDFEVKKHNKVETSSSSMMDKIIASIEKDKSTTPSKISIDNDKSNDTNILDDKQRIQANRYLHEQQKSKNMVRQNAQHDAKEVLVETKTQTKPEQKIEKSAKILELGLSKVEVKEIEKEEGLKVEQSKLDQYVFKKSFTALHRAYLQEHSNSNKVETPKELVETKVNVETEQKIDNKLEIKNIELKVDRTALEVFTSRVIAAKQKTETFMSDLARQMYQNYKPPITAFRINLNPANLGSIAIMIKSNKSENSLSVSMNMTQVNTYETLNENKTSLQNAIAKNFLNDSEISLDLSFNDNSNSEFESMYEEEQKRLASNNTQTDNIEEIINDSQSSDYM
jgi:hypothetical protein